MTRQFKITSIEPEGSERILVLTALDRPDHQIYLQPGREVIMAVHDAAPAVVLSKVPLKNIVHPVFEVGITGAPQGIDGEKTSAQYEQELVGKDAVIEKLQAQVERLSGSQGEQLTEDQIDLMLQDLAGGDANAIDFDAMTKAELVEYAAGIGLTVDAGALKADLLAAVKSAVGPR